MECAGCSGMIRRELYKRSGIHDVRINYVTDKAYVEYDPQQITADEIRKVIEKVGYKAVQAQAKRRHR